jgi:hypothetical protein
MIILLAAFGGLALITFFVCYRSFRASVGEALFIAVLGPGVLCLLILGIVYSGYLF